MFIHLRHTELVTASPERLFSVLTDYDEYPRWNRNVISTTVIRRDEHEAEVLAERTTLIGKKVRFIDTYAPKPLLQFERRYIGNETARSTWTVEPAHNGQAYFTIEAEMTLRFFPGIFQRPILKRMFYRINFPPFIRAAESFGNRVVQPSF
jgi:ribosome-associated toxin RatA of RatAB toxin-antitoxin module